MATSGQQLDEALENLARLAAKPGVKATLILNKHDGSIIQSTGLQRARNDEHGDDADQDNLPKSNASLDTTAASNSDAVRPETKSINAEKLAQAVLALINSATSFAHDWQHEDGVRLLRLRLRQDELVIVPNEKFLLVVVHETVTH